MSHLPSSTRLAAPLRVCEPRRIDGQDDRRVQRPPRSLLADRASGRLLHPGRRQLPSHHHASATSVMNTVRLRATSLHVPVGHATSDYWRNHHHSLLDIQFTRLSLVGTLDWREGVALIAAQLLTDQSTSENDLLALANTAIVGAQYAAFQIAEGTITTAITGWPAGGAVGLLTGSQIAKSGPPF